MKNETTLKIEGMSCGHCALTVRKELESMKGLTVKNVKVGSAVVEFDDTQIKVDDIKSLLAKSGYDVVSAN